MPQENNHSQVCWSHDDEQFNCDSLQQLLTENEDLKPGTTVWKAEKHVIDPTCYVDAGDVIDMLGERAYDDGGDATDHWPDVPNQARQELDALLSAWIDKHCSPAPFFHVMNAQPYIITEADLLDRGDP